MNAKPSVRRYSEQEIANAYTKFRMAIKGNIVPGTSLFVRAEHYEGMQTFLSCVSWDRQREHDLRVTMQGRAETAEAALKEAFELLLFAQSEAGPIGPYVTAEEEKFSRQRWTDIDSFLRRYASNVGEKHE
jgi:hypothetical protein